MICPWCLSHCSDASNCRRTDRQTAVQSCTTHPTELNAKKSKVPTVKCEQIQDSAPMDRRAGNSIFEEIHYRRRRGQPFCFLFLCNVTRVSRQGLSCHAVKEILHEHCMHCRHICHACLCIAAAPKKRFWRDNVQIATHVPHTTNSEALDKRQTTCLVAVEHMPE